MTDLTINFACESRDEFRASKIENWMVVGRGYFSHDSSHSKNVATAHRVDCCLFYSLDLQQTITLSEENLNIFGEVCACLFL